MHNIDWIVLTSTLTFVVFWSIYQSRRAARETTMKDFTLSGREAKWYTVAISVMGTQASAITFISLPGQAYVDGMRFVQTYLGLPFAMVLLCVVALPMYRRLNVLTIYEFLERRYDLKTRTLASLLFLLQRSLAASISLYAPSIVLSIILGWNVAYVILIIGVLMALYTVSGGARAVAWAQSYQMAIILVGMASVGFFAVLSLPPDVSFGDALSVAALNGKLNAVDYTFDLNNKYTIWSGILGGFFLQLSYFGTDQSQAQRYLSGESVAQSRLGLLFNGLVKIPMQFGILLIGAMIFVFYQFTAPPLFFNKAEIDKLAGTPYQARYEELSREHIALAVERIELLRQLRQEELRGNETQANKRGREEITARLRQNTEAAARTKDGARKLLLERDQQAATNDTNYIFLTFVVTYLPVGLVGLLIAVVFSASMSSTSSEINALASTTVVDVYRRIFGGALDERRAVWVTRVATIGWTAIIVVFAQFMGSVGSLIEAVNTVGSLFYGGILGIFIAAFFLKRSGGTAVFLAALINQCIVFGLYYFTNISFLWYNLIGCALTVAIAAALSPLFPPTKTRP